MEKMKPAIPVLVGSLMAIVVYFFPEARPYACGITLATGAALVP